MDYNRIKYDHDNHPAELTKSLVEGLRSKEIKPSEFSLRKLCEALVGREYVDSLGGDSKPILESGGVQLADFSSITGQIVFTEILVGYELPEFIFSAKIRKIQSQFPGVERIAGITNLGDMAEQVEEMQPYPIVGVSEDYVDVAAKIKRGFIVAVSAEAIAFDRTGILLKQCNDTGRNFGFNRENRVIDTLIDGNGAANSIYTNGGARYQWRGTSYATFQSAAPWINLKTTNGLTDWTSIQSAWLQYVAMTDPYTGQPTNFFPKQLICAPQLDWTARRIVSATNVRVVTPGYETSGNPSHTESKNPVMPLEILSSQMLAARMTANSDVLTSWYLSDMEKAVAIYYNWDIQTEQAAANSPASFERDVVAQYRVRNRETTANMQPRASQKNTA